MAFEITPEEYDLGEALLFSGSPVAFVDEVEELLSETRYTRPLNDDEVERLAWRVGYTFAEEAPLYVKVSSIDLGERLATRFARNFGRESVAAEDLVTATNCVTFLGRASLTGKFEALRLERLIRTHGKLSIEHELARMLGQDE
jgi:hypothetical protein